MRKWLVCVLLFMTLLFPSPVRAQAGVKLDSLDIELWPEFDRSSMLVIHQFVVSEDTTLPVSVKVRFPKEGNLYAVAIQNTDGKLYTKDFESPAEQGDWQSVTIQVNSYQPHRIEYYQPLTLSGNKRQFKYRWFGDYSVKQFKLMVLVPVDSTDLVTDPPLETTATSQDGTMTTGTVTKNDMKSMQSFQFDLQYQRTSEELNPQGQKDQVQPSEPIGKSTAGRVSISNLPWIIGGFGMALIVIALFSYWRSTFLSDEKAPRRRRRPPEPEAVADGQAYCHECGTRAHTGDRFCRTCGSRLRSNE